MSFQFDIMEKKKTYICTCFLFLRYHDIWVLWESWLADIWTCGKSTKSQSAVRNIWKQKKYFFLKTFVKQRTKLHVFWCYSMSGLPGPDIFIILYVGRIGHFIGLLLFKNRIVSCPCSFALPLNKDIYKSKLVGGK